jgi:Putative zinc- or iron-chelating domain
LRLTRLQSVREFVVRDGGAWPVQEMVVGSSPLSGLQLDAKNQLRRTMFLRLNRKETGMRRLSKSEISHSRLTLSELYELTDEALADMPKPPCSARTCNGCCWSPPTITEAEFVHIQEHVNLENVAPASEPWCRFYEEATGACRIYPVRPLECRLVAVLDTYRFNCCAPAAQPEPMPPSAVLLRELLYRTLYQVNGGVEETHINVLFDQARKKEGKPAVSTRLVGNSLGSRLSRGLLWASFWLVRAARRLAKPPNMVGIGNVR